MRFKFDQKGASRFALQLFTVSASVEVGFIAFITSCARSAAETVNLQACIACVCAGQVVVPFHAIVSISLHPAFVVFVWDAVGAAIRSLHLCKSAVC